MAFAFISEQDRLAQPNLNYVWDTNTLSWVKETQPGGSSGGDGAINDGANSTIKATVFDYANSNPLAVRLTDTNGDYVSAGGGTEYTEDAASPADPVGKAITARRRDSLAAETTTDGDWVVANSTNKGELYVKHVDAIPVTDNAGSLTIDGTVTANQGTPAAAANRWPVQITDGTDLALVTAAGEINVLATAQPGVDIGDVTVNNAAGAAAVNIQDGGNSITVDGSVTASGTVTANQGTPAATANRWPVQVTDGTDLALVTAAGEQNVLATAQPGVDIGDVTINNASGGSAVNIQDGGNSITVDGTVSAAITSIPTGAGQTLLFAVISQGAAGTTTLVTADATKKIKVVSYVIVISATGTAKFIDSTPTDLTGAMAIATNGGVSAIGTTFSPLFATAVNKSLQIVSTVGAISGHLSYFLEA